MSAEATTPAPTGAGGAAAPAGDDRTTVFQWVLRSQRRSLTLWGLALAAVASLYITIFPAMGAEELQATTESLPQGMIEAFGYQDIGTAAGYINSSVYGLLGPILLLVFGIGLGARLIAGEEQRGTLELELTGPTSRRNLYLQRLEALVVNVVVLVVVIGVMSAVLITALDLDVAMSNLAQTTLGLALLVEAFSLVSLAVGAATGRRALALGAAAGLAVASWALDAIGPTIDAGWMTAVSPFSWFGADTPLANGSDPLGLVLLALLGVVAGAAGMVAFERRDLMV